MLVCVIRDDKVVIVYMSNLPAPFLFSFHIGTTSIFQTQFTLVIINHSELRLHDLKWSL